MKEDKDLEKAYQELKKKFPEPIKDELKFIACNPSDLHLFEKLEGYEKIEGDNSEPRVAGYFNCKRNKYIKKVPVIVNSELEVNNITYVMTDISVHQQMKNEIFKESFNVAAPVSLGIWLGRLCAYIDEKENEYVYAKST